MENNLELTESGLVCDNPKCDWTDNTIYFENYKEWINKPCPKCGENVLTEQDYQNAEIAMAVADMINALSPEQLETISKNVNIDELSKSELMKDAEGIQVLSKKGKMNVSIRTHEKIKVTEIKKSE